MTYARARLWLGITGVGSLVVASACVIWFGMPDMFLNSRAATPAVEALQLLVLVTLLSVWLMPFDFVGGIWLPRTYGKSRLGLNTWLRRYLPAAALQASFFLGFSLLMLALSRRLGLLGGMTAVLFGFGVSAWLRHRQMGSRRDECSESNGKLLDALALIQSWQVFVPKTIVVQHQDPGFTGGIIGLGKRVKIVLPKAWLRLSTEQLATAIARRALAVQTGSYQWGVFGAFAWNFTGFFLSSVLPGAGLTTVASLATTVAGLRCGPLPAC